MIATEAKISGIDETRRQYYDYLSTIYGEISSYLKITDGMVNAQKLGLMFEKATSPFVYWKENHKAAAQQAMPDDKREELLQKLQRKYGLMKIGDAYQMGNYLTDPKFHQLKDSMKLAGYAYNPKEKAFVPGGPNDARE